MHKRICLVFAAATLGVAVSSSAFAAPSSFCKGYAKSAVSNFHQMRSLGLSCGGYRWHDWYDGHYRWCRSTSKDAARAETLARKRTMFSNRC